jgi:hypothetical protein
MIKRETRILGLSGAKGKAENILVVGIVFRGNLWLDGVLTCQLKPRHADYLLELVKAILRLRQYSQIHAIILWREELASGNPIDISKLSRETNIPVMSIGGLNVRTRANRPGGNRTETKSNADSFQIQLEEGVVGLKAVGIPYKETCEVFGVACAAGEPIPEALRVAQVVVRHLTRHHVHPRAE